LRLGSVRRFHFAVAVPVLWLGFSGQVSPHFLHRNPYIRAALQQNIQKKPFNSAAAVLKSAGNCRVCGLRLIL
jgi:hypothetical protein